MIPRALLVGLALAGAAILAGCTAPPEHLTCRADREGNHLTWDAVENATSYNVYRGEAGSDFMDSTYLGSTVETSFTDVDVVVGESYRYWVTSVGPLPAELTGAAEASTMDETTSNETAPAEETDEGEVTTTTAGPEESTDEPTFFIPDETESPPSEPCDVTAVPEFPGLIVAVSVGIVAVGAYVAMRRLTRP